MLPSLVFSPFLLSSAVHDDQQIRPASIFTEVSSDIVHQTPVIKLSVLEPDGMERKAWRGGGEKGVREGGNEGQESAGAKMQSAKRVIQVVFQFNSIQFK